MKWYWLSSCSSFHFLTELEAMVRLIIKRIFSKLVDTMLYTLFERDNKYIQLKPYTKVKNWRYMVVKPQCMVVKPYVTVSVKFAQPNFLFNFSALFAVAKNKLHKFQPIVVSSSQGTYSTKQYKGQGNHFVQWLPEK